MAIEILDKGACKAAGVVDTLAAVLTCRAQGIRRVISTGAPGIIRLVLVEGIGQDEFVGEATCEPPSVGPGIIAEVLWIDAFTIEIQTHGEDGAAAAGIVHFFFFSIDGLGTPAIVSPPPPDPLAVMTQAGLLGWWAANQTTLVAGKASAAADQSGNGKNLGQGVAGERLGFNPAGSVRGLPCWVADGTLQALFNNALAPGAGDFVSMFAIMTVDPAAAAFASAAMLSDGTGATVAEEIINFGGCGLFTNGIGGGGFKLWTTALNGPRSASLVLSAAPTEGRISGNIVAPTVPPATSGGVPAGLTRFTLGADTIVNVGGGIVPWTGELYEAWLTATTPTPTQLAELLTYIATKYGPI